MRPSLTLDTERLLLRDFRRRDWKAVHVYASDPEVVKFMPWGPNTEEGTKAFIERVIKFQEESPRQHFELAAVLKEDGALIGGCGLNVTSEADKTGCIGYCYNRRYWGRGLATEAAEALLCHGFGELGLHRIWATCDTQNLPSARVLEKSGMTLEGCLRESALVRGRWRDSFLYAILEGEWSRQKEKGRSGHVGGEAKGEA